MRVVGNIASDSEVVATADGAITAGKPVVVNADGTVKFAASTTATLSFAVGAESVFENSNTEEMQTAFDSANNKVVIWYTDSGNSNYPTAVVGTVDASNNSISFGTPVVAASVGSDHLGCDYDVKYGKVLCCYSDTSDSNKGKGILGTVSGTSISFGTIRTWETGSTSDIVCRYAPDVERVVIGFRDRDNSHYGKIAVSLNSGTEPAVYGAVNVHTNETYEIDMSYDTTANKMVYLYIDHLNDVKVNVLDITTTGATVGSQVNVKTGTCNFTRCEYDSSNDKTIITYADGGNSGYGTAVIGTVDASSNSITIAGTTHIWNSASSDNGHDIIFDNNVNKFLIAYRDQGDSNYGNAVVGEVSGTSISFGDEQEFDSTGIIQMYYGSSLVFDSNSNKAVVAYFIDGTATASHKYGRAKVIQLDGSATTVNLTSENFIGFAKDNVADGAVATIQTANSIARDNIQAPTTSDTVGTAVVFESGDAYTYKGSVYDSNSDRIVIFYRDGDDSNYGKAIVGTVSGNSVTFGTAVTFISESVSGIRAVFDSNSNKVVVFYKNGTDTEGRAHVGTVDPSDNSISFGSEATFNAGNSYEIGAAFDSTNNKIVVCFRDFGDSSKGKAIVGTVSGTSISFGSEVEFDDSFTAYHSTVFDPDTGKIVNFYQDQGNSSYGTAIVGTVSGTSISFGTATEFAAASSLYTKPVYVSHLDKTVIGYQDVDDSYKGTYIVGTVSGTDISFNSEAVYSANATYFNDTLYDPTAKKVIFSYWDDTNNDSGTVTVLDLAGGDADLTIGQTYFVQTDGTLGLSADDPSVIAGTAISGTDLIVKG